MSQHQSLAEQISSFQEGMLPQIPEAALNTLISTTQQLVESGQAERALKTGDHCPDFTLPNAFGALVPLSEKLRAGPLVISFYRGAWCPYCNLEIRALAAQLDQFRQHGADLVAISPQVVDKAAEQATELELKFEVLSDAGNHTARQFGLVFTVPGEVQPIFDAFEFDVPGHNGDDRYELPIPATYIVDQQGKIRYAYVNADYTQRLEPAVIVEQLRKL
jgi:peroxiredoxin